MCGKQSTLHLPAVAQEYSYCRAKAHPYSYQLKAISPMQALKTRIAKTHRERDQPKKNQERKNP